MAMRDPSPSWSEEHRLVLAIVTGATAVMLAFGFFSIGKAIKSPFLDRGPGYQTLEQKETEAMAALKVKDTDGDGLTDYEEVYIYHTSAYIADSDSDSISDGAEVKANEDPNCPRGKDCGPNPYYSAPAAQSGATDLLSGLPNPLDYTGYGATPGTILDSSVLGQFDAAKIRDLLKASGVSAEMLASISDTQLEQLYTETLESQVPTSSDRFIITSSTTP